MFQFQGLSSLKNKHSKTRAKLPTRLIGNAAQVAVRVSESKFIRQLERPTYLATMQDKLVLIEARYPSRKAAHQKSKKLGRRNKKGNNKTNKKKKKKKKKKKWRK
jgi:hypothetical protein